MKKVKPLKLPSPREPMAVARSLTDARYRAADGLLTLGRWRGGWWNWRKTHWSEIEPADIQAETYTFTEHAIYVEKGEV